MREKRSRILEHQVGGQERKKNEEKGRGDEEDEAQDAYDKLTTVSGQDF